MQMPVAALLSAILFEWLGGVVLLVMRMQPALSRLGWMFARLMCSQLAMLASADF